MIAAGLPLAPDPALPCRDTLLDDEQMRVRLATLLAVTTDRPLPIDRVTRVRVKYRPGENLRVLHRVAMAGRSYLVSSRMRRDDIDGLFTDAARGAVEREPLRGVAVDHRLSCVFWTFPNDRRLRPVGELVDVHAACERLYPGHRLKLEMAGYAPERAVVFRVSKQMSGRLLAYAKVFAPAGMEPARQVLQLLEQANGCVAAPVRVPRVLASDRQGELLVTEVLPGAHLHALADADLDVALPALGTALGRLHALPVAGGVPEVNPFDAPAIREAAAVLSTARPDVAAAAQALADRLIATQPAVGATAWLHGDLNSRNWLLHDGEVGLFDFDGPARGPAGVDVGGVLAWMHTRTLLGGWTAAREAQLAAALVSAYCAVAPRIGTSELAWYRSAALLVQRAQRAVTRVREAQLQALPAMLAAASDGVWSGQAGVAAGGARRRA